MVVLDRVPMVIEKPKNSWKKKLSWKVMENLLKIGSHQILLRTKKNFLKLLVILVAVT